jgi:hypothetical protein
MAKVKNSNTEVPKWFNGMIYSNGGAVTNRFSGATVELNNIELSIYDFIMGVAYSGIHHKDFDRARYWFAEVNSNAYMELLD